MSKIPVIDLSPLAERTSECRRDQDGEKCTALADGFVQALREFGFAYIVNHGVPAQVVHERV